MELLTVEITGDERAIVDTTIADVAKRVNVSVTGVMVLEDRVCLRDRDDLMMLINVLRLYNEEALAMAILNRGERYLA